MLLVLSLYHSDWYKKRRADQLRLAKQQSLHSISKTLTGFPAKLATSASTHRTLAV
jgi:hypothetical protein